ncbi:MULTISPECIES: Rieske 2Fe-2S domain-containing protein [Thiomicrorhabdus]|uniref:Rieske 2Fe-2S domain-containing protein n=1 Tax=Thiomicrorhabdus heinhorstiae TaxID=2748010 RepID=A0ABS0BXV7_9GAMM|nr:MULTISPECIES: Rieske 2Fe-2S domain-containing protein [Thiomicrorhabdus]MBF6058239.1 Rieske 2Fe-2S domain-containing protein [Thiomicrorhabdus heinhorstiae]
MNRRELLKACGMGVAASFVPQFLVHASEIAFPKSLLTKEDGSPLRSKDIQVKTEYQFPYPYKSTPCFLIDMGAPLKQAELSEENGSKYKWLGGSGPHQSVVAFLAICPHQLQYPNKNFSMINFNPKHSDVAEGPGMITCCAHNSVYDPTKGGKVMKGPATNPLTAVKLEYNAAKDEYWAVALYGHDLVADFFKAYKRDLKKEYGRSGYKEMSSDKTAVVLGKSVSAMKNLC